MSSSSTEEIMSSWTTGTPLHLRIAVYYNIRERADRVMPLVLVVLGDLKTAHAKAASSQVSGSVGSARRTTAEEDA